MFFFVIGILAIAGALIASRLSWTDRGTTTQVPGVFVIAGIGIGVLCLFGSVIRIVPANAVGIPVTFGSVGGEMNSGLQITTPFTQIRTFSTRLQELTLGDKDNGEREDAIEVRGSDGYVMRVGVTVRYKVKQESAVPLFRRVGSMDGIRDRIVRPEVNEAVRVVFANYTAEDGYSIKRTEVSADINDLIRQRLEAYGLELDAVLVRNVDPDSTLKEAIAARSAARERSLQAKLEQEKQVTEAETRKQVAQRDAEAIVTKAEGEAQVRIIDGQARKQSITDITGSLTAVYVDYVRAQALSSANTIYVPTDSTIMIAGATTK